MPPTSLTSVASARGALQLLEWSPPGAGLWRDGNEWVRLTVMEEASPDNSSMRNWPDFSFIQIEHWDFLSRPYHPADGSVEVRDSIPSSTSFEAYQEHLVHGYASVPDSDGDICNPDGASGHDQYTGQVHDESSGDLVAEYYLLTRSKDPSPGEDFAQYWYVNNSDGRLPSRDTYDFGPLSRTSDTPWDWLEGMKRDHGTDGWSFTYEHVSFPSERPPSETQTPRCL